MHARLLLTLIFAATLAQSAEAPSQPAPASAASDKRAVMTGDQVVQILDKTVDWYRTLGVQQQAATQPSDLLILYANRQTAEQVMALAFEIARANAELLSSEAGEQRAQQEETSTQSLSKVQKKLDEQRATLAAQIESVKRDVEAAPKANRGPLQARVAVLQSELDLLNARRNLLASMSQFEGQSDTNGFGPNALKAHIDAIAASIPSAMAATTPAANGKATEDDDASAANSAATSFGQFGIWDLASTVLRLSAKARTIKTVDERTAALQKVFNDIRTPPLEQLKSLAARGDALSAQTGNADAKNLQGVRSQYDTIAWLFSQTAAIVTPLSKAEVLLSQYRRNLDNWREATDRQYREALEALGLRLALFAALLALVFLAAELWRRAVFRYVHEGRRRSRFLLLRKIVLWFLVVAIAASTFATELGSLATFAGLITAGLAVAMQSVLVSVVGYFFLIGKYGIRVGDRVQIGSVTGEVIEMGLVRLHLMEFSGEGSMSPTGRVVAFANSIIFQASGGLFKQIPGVNLAWHELTVGLPQGADYAALKDELIAAVTNVIKDYREDIVRQAQEIQKATAARDVIADPQPQVQLRFTIGVVEAYVRYPVQLAHAAEMDERVSREVLNVVSARAQVAAPAQA
jgi:small-conductance mechanosensitive channel